MNDLASNTLIATTYTILITCAGIYPKNESSTYLEVLSTTFNDNGTDLLKSTLAIGGFLLLFLNLLKFGNRNNDYSVWYYIIFLLAILVKLLIIFFNWKNISVVFLIVPVLAFMSMGMSGSPNKGATTFFQDLNEKTSNIYVISLITNYKLTTYCLNLIFAGTEAVLCCKFTFLYSTNTFDAKHVETLIIELGKLIDSNNAFLIVVVFTCGIVSGLVHNYNSAVYKKPTSKFCQEPAVWSCILTFIQFHVYSWNFDLGYWDYIFKFFHCILLITHFICYLINRENYEQPSSDVETGHHARENLKKIIQKHFESKYDLLDNDIDQLTEKIEKIIKESKEQVEKKSRRAKITDLDK